MTRRQPSAYNWSKMQFDETIMGKHFTRGRNRKIQFVVAHHMTIIGSGNGSANTACYNTWQTRQASAHYGVDGQHVRQFVWDRDAAWACGSGLGNHAGISIEHANSTAGPRWQISDTTWRNGARLAAYLHKAHGLGRPTTSNGGRGGTLRKHSSFFATACPGPFMDSIWSQYVAEAQRVYDAISKGGTPPPTTNPKPEPEKEWFDMATEAQLRKIVREEVERNRVTRSPNAPATVYKGKKSVLVSSGVARVWSVTEAILKAVRVKVARPSHLPDNVYAGTKAFSQAQAQNRFWTVVEATLKELRETRALVEAQADKDGLPVASLLATVKPFMSEEVPDETPEDAADEVGEES